MSYMKLKVLGAGIIGLTCALRLREVGHEVELVAADRPERTTSAVAAALWYPYRTQHDDAVRRWAHHTYQVLEEMARSEPAAGVTLRAGRDLYRQPAQAPWWQDTVRAYRRLAPAELPAGYTDGFEMTAPVIDMAIHLEWLLARIQAMGVATRWERIEDLDAAGRGFDATVNCTGLGARDLEGDSSLTPSRGQVVIVEQVGLEQWTLDQSDPEQLTYVVPRANTIVLGGTAEDGDEDLAIRPATRSAIVERCAALAPQIEHARVLDNRVGLRPIRQPVRLESERRVGDRTVVHCYGHGGAGVTLSYGCAQEVVGILASAD